MSKPALNDVLHILMTALLCLCVLLQILGVAVSFWDLNDSDDPFTTSIITGFSIPSIEQVLSPLLQRLLGFSITGSGYQHLRQDMLFHPPLS